MEPASEHQSEAPDPVPQAEPAIPSEPESMTIPNDMRRSYDVAVIRSKVGHRTDLLSPLGRNTTTES